MSSDELEIVGFFIAHGGLHWIVDSPGDRIELNPNYSNVFGRIYRARMGGPPVRYEPTEPFLSDLSGVLEARKACPRSAESSQNGKEAGTKRAMCLRVREKIQAVLREIRHRGQGKSCNAISLA